MPKVTLTKPRRSSTAVKPSSKAVSVKPSRATPAKKKTEIKGLTLKQIVNATPPLIKHHSLACTVRSLREATTKGGFPAVRAKVESERKANKRYSVDIVGKEGPDKPLYKQKVLVSCNCEAFCYYCEVALTHWGSSKIKYSNGEHPDVTNPGLLPMGCKHVMAVAREVIEKKL